MIRSLTSEQKEELIDRIAELEHEQWMEWSTSIAPLLKELSTIVSVFVAKRDLVLKTTIQLERWNSFWVPYGMLNEEVKDQDREGARKVLQIFKELNMEIIPK